MTSTGNGSANPCTTSPGGPASRSASSSSVAIRTAWGRKDSRRDTVKAGVASRRNRVCSGGSSPARVSTGFPTAVMRGTLSLAAATALKRGSDSTSFTSSYRVTNQPSSP